MSYRKTHAFFVGACLTGATLIIATAAGAAPLALDDAERIALERDDSLHRMAALADARAARAVADGALPDPELSLGYRNIPVDGFSTTADMMTMLTVGVRQRFPAGDSRRLNRDRGELEADALRAELEGRALEIRRTVRQAWLDWRYARLLLEVARAVEADFRELTAVTERRLAAGTARGRDASQARLELAALSERIITLEARHDTAAAELARWLDEPVDGRSPGDAPHWPPPDADLLRRSLPNHPSLRAPGIRTEAAHVGAEIARQAYRPVWMAEVSYGIRNGDDMVTGRSKSDLLTGMVSVSIPMFTGNRQDRRLEAALRERDASRSDHADRMRRLAGSLELHWAMWRRLDELADLYRERLLPEAEDTSTGTVGSYRNDQATFDELVRARVAELEYRLRALQVARQRDGSRIELLYLAGE